MAPLPTDNLRCGSLTTISLLLWRDTHTIYNCSSNYQRLASRVIIFPPVVRLTRAPTTVRRRLRRPSTKTTTSCLGWLAGLVMCGDGLLLLLLLDYRFRSLLIGFLIHAEQPARMSEFNLPRTGAGSFGSRPRNTTHAAAAVQQCYRYYIYVDGEVGW